MTLAALARPLYAQLSAALPAVTDALRAQRPLVKQKMAQAARAGVVTPAVRSELIAELTAASAPSLGSSVPAVVAFETTANFSARDRAAEGVEAGFNAGTLGKMITDAYWKALQDPQGANVAVASLGDVRINVAGAVYGAAAAGTPQAAAATAEATSVVGPAGAPGLPAVAPPASLVGQITAIPGTWATAGSALEAGVTPAAFATQMEAGLKSAAAAEAGVAAALALMGMAPPKIPRAGALYRRAYQLVTNASKAAATQVATDLLSTTVTPVLTSSVAALQSTIGTEVTRLMTTPSSGVAAAGPPDPNMAAIVAAMKARIDAGKAATAGTRRDPLGATGGTAPAQDVTYSYQGLMGSNATTAMRGDQFDPMVKQFNDKLKTFFEKNFTADVK
jgi:hypothetical protein